MRYINRLFTLLTLLTVVVVVVVAVVKFDYNVKCPNIEPVPSYRCHGISTDLRIKSDNAVNKTWTAPSGNNS